MCAHNLGGYVNPRNDDKGNYDDTEFPADRENADAAQQPTTGREADSGHQGRADDEGDYDDKDQ